MSLNEQLATVVHQRTRGNGISQKSPPTACQAQLALRAKDSRLQRMVLHSEFASHSQGVAIDARNQRIHVTQAGSRGVRSDAG